MNMRVTVGWVEARNPTKKLHHGIVVYMRPS
jgi:hypothetical protein